MIEFVQGDIFDKEVDIRINTVNCVGVMGAGVALAFKQRYPEMFKDYQSACKSGLVRPGVMHIWRSLEGDWIINFPTKRDWKEPSRYEDIDSGLDDLRQYLNSIGPVTVALPALGCGHGGLDWNRVSDMISQKLEGISAHIYVFEPSASRRAGNRSSFTSDNELKLVEQLGFKAFRGDNSAISQMFKYVFSMGHSEVLAQKWIALLHSRSPGEREMNALKTISTELANSKYRVSVALVYGTKVSMDIASMFARQGIDTILIMPFGILTRQALVKNIASQKLNSLTIMSFVSPNEKWSRQIYAQTINGLRSNAGAMLLSVLEFEGDAYENSLRKWEGIPVSYINYENIPSLLRDTLSSFGAKSIGRRSETGSPNMDYLLSAFGNVNKVCKSNSVELNTNDEMGDVVESVNEKNRTTIACTEYELYRFSCEEQALEKKRLIFEALLKMSIDEIIIKLSNDATANEQNRLLKFGFNRIKK